MARATVSRLGSVPPAGWTPDPTWPPAPDGWNFWIEDPALTNPPAAGVAATPAGTPVAPKQNLVQGLHGLLAQQLEPGEELRWYGVVYQYKAPAFIVGLFSWSILLPAFGPLIALILRRVWYVGITSKRLLFMRFQSKKAAITSVPLGAATVLRKGRKTGRLLVADPPAPLPTRFTLFRGKNVDELEVLLGTSRVATPRFNVPPGWRPPPPGWTPPPGWQPAPEWPPAPPGWVFWN